jgi:hypothetical protein
VKDIAKKFMERFHGLDRAYGTYDLKRSKTVKREGDKILGEAVTIKKDVSEKLWKNHLNGTKGIGIVPIRDDSTCFFGAIDIDTYTGLDIKKIIKDIKNMDLPLISCRSKSGGVHCFTFVKEPVSAVLMRDKLSSFAAILGFGGSEIFPKQTEVIADRGDIGQWINMPYFNQSDTNRYAFKDNLKPMSVSEFIEAIDKVWFTKKEFNAFTINLLSDISDGPPCLQYLVTKGFSPGSRNDGLFNMAIYLKKAYPDNWEELLDDYNERFFNPSLSTSEVSQIAKSLKRKEYNFTCDKPPIKSYCNISLCRSRQHGIGQLTGMPQLTGLTKFDSNPPIWFLDVDGGGRLELTTEELQSQGKFQKRCMEVLNSMPPGVKANTWQELIQALLENVTIIEAPFDASPRGMLFEYLERFCTSRAQARTKDELLLGKPWTAEDFHYFRIIDFMAYLERNRFKEFKVHRICSILKEHGGEHQFFKIKGKGINAWRIPEFAQQIEGFETPDFDEEEVF